MCECVCSCVCLCVARVLSILFLLPVVDIAHLKHALFLALFLARVLATFSGCVEVQAHIVCMRAVGPTGAWHEGMDG